MQEMTPLVSVIMPAYNAEKTLEKTYNEIYKEIVDEIILTDDKSISRFGISTLSGFT